jgi:hypothetical protein
MRPPGAQHRRALSAAPDYFMGGGRAGFGALSAAEEGGAGGAVSGGVSSPRAGAPPSARGDAPPAPPPLPRVSEGGSPPRDPPPPLPRPPPAPRLRSSHERACASLRLPRQLLAAAALLLLATCISVPLIFDGAVKGDLLWARFAVAGQYLNVQVVAGQGLPPRALPAPTAPESGVRPVDYEAPPDAEAAPRNPFVEVHIWPWDRLGEIYRTRVANATLSPQWQARRARRACGHRLGTARAGCGGAAGRAARAARRVASRQAAWARLTRGG